MSDLEARLSRLETSNRRWKLGAIALLLVVGVAGADFAANVGVFDTIKCKKIQIDGNSLEFVDGNGKMVSAVLIEGGIACKKLLVINDQFKDVCTIFNHPEPGKTVGGQVYLYGDKGGLSTWSGGTSPKAYPPR